MSEPEVVITLTAKTDLTRRGEPVTCGVPFPEGMVQNADDLRLFDELGNSVPLQTEVLDKWSDGSARWVLCDWQAFFPESRKYRLRLMPGHAQFQKLRESFDVLEQISECKLGVTVTETRLQSLDKNWTSQRRGVIRSEARNSGDLDEGKARFGLRCSSFEGHPVAKLSLTITNPTPAEHPGGCWDLGAVTSWNIWTLGLIFPWVGQGRATISYEPKLPFETISTGFRLLQESSGGENWNSRNHINSTREVNLGSSGYRVFGEFSREGHRSTPVLSVENEVATLSISYPEFWQNFPKSLSFGQGGIWLELFPYLPGYRHELQGGEQKTHTFYVAFGKDTITDSPLEWTRDPLIAVVDPAWIASTKVIPYLTPKSEDIHADYLHLVDAAIEGADTFEKKREVIDEYGWRHFGDIYGDHEAVLHPEFPRTPRVSHYNNQYDAVAGFCYQWLRSGDPRWVSQMRELAQHVIDIDIYHTDGDKSAYNHGLFWHTYHYVDADTGTHRSYPKRGKVPPHGKPVPGGGPSNEHNYATGLMLHYFLTGDVAAREAAIGLAQWVIDMDDGNRTIFRWLCRSETGLASQSRSPDYHGPGRGSANSVSVLLDGHRLTGNRKFLDKAEQIIRRVIHPKDDIPARNLLDAENRWFYTMFLQALGKYLDNCVERDDLGFMYAYARESFLAYARWMLANEYPYLQRPERLEYPTETWAAQDLRKGEIFHHAMMHSSGEEREQFRRGASFFFHVPIQQLGALPTRTLCRPVVLLLSFGWMHNYFRLNPDETRPIPDRHHDFGQPTRFLPQKTIAKKRAKLIAAGMFALGILGVLWLLLK